MSMSRFFIERPIFASVINIIIVIAGFVAANVLPVSQYPQIAPPTVVITTNYPGASAETLAKTVASPIEQQLNGVENLMYFSSTAATNGQLTITVTFEVGTNVDQAVFNVNNRVQIALPTLPDDVRRNGVIVQKKSNDILLVIGVTSPDQSKDTLFLSNYASLNIVDDIKRIPGVGDVTVFGARDYSMRVWLKPDRMAQLGVTTTDITAAINAQNAQYAAGKIGAEPAPEGQNLVYTVNAQGRLIEPEQFGEIIIRAGGTTGTLRLKDVARIELGAQNYDSFNSLNGKPAIGSAVFLQSGANALEVAQSVYKKMEELKPNFPAGVSYTIPFDTTRVVSASIHEVIMTIFEAAVLVVLVVFLFLQTGRATLIPMIAVPVSLIGSFAGLWIAGFSINTLTLFAMVLAIGIVVDDAIVVLENVERLMREQGLNAKQAAIEAMNEVSGAVVAIVLVLCSVFIPVAFLGGIAGQLYKQFAVTVAISVVISGFTALTLTPALCALLLKPGDHESKLFRPFNNGFQRLTNAFLYCVTFILKHRFISLCLFLGMLGFGVFTFIKVPNSFIPSEDQGFLYGQINLPDGASLQRTSKTGDQIRNLIKDNPAIENLFVINGFDLIGGGNKTNAGTMFIPLKPWDDREITAPDLAKEIIKKGSTLPDGVALAFNPPAIRGLGSAGGFEFYLQSRASADVKKLAEVVKNFTGELQKHPALTGVNAFLKAGIPQLLVDVDREKAMALGVPVNDIFVALQSTMGTYYVNDFNKFGRSFRVQLQADAPYRAKPEDLGAVYVRSNTTGEMIPLKAFIHTTNVSGADQLDRFNGFIASKMIGNGKPGISSGDAIKAVEEVASKTLPQGYAIAWSGQAFQEKRASSASAFAFGFALVMVYLILAALYERWRLPASVLLAVPFAIFGALGFVALRGMENDIYFQIGLVVLIGLAAKNAILIVEFAQQGLLEGKSAIDAALDAARLRFRPIVMTSLAFVLGVVPLVFASGAGAAARKSMGTGVFGGMLVATFIATIFVPLFFTVLSRKNTTNPKKQASIENKEI